MLSASVGIWAMADANILSEEEPSQPGKDGSDIKGRTGAES